MDNLFRFWYTVFLMRDSFLKYWDTNWIRKPKPNPIKIIFINDFHLIAFYLLRLMQLLIQEKDSTNMFTQSMFLHSVCSRFGLLSVTFCLFVPPPPRLTESHRKLLSAQLPWEQSERCRKWPSIPPHFLSSGPWLLVLDEAHSEPHAINMH